MRPSNVVRLAAVTLAVVIACTGIITIFLPTPASAAEATSSAFDQFPKSVRLTPASSDAWDVTIKMGVPGWDGRAMTKKDGSASPWSYGYVYPVTLVDNGGGSRGPGMNYVAVGANDTVGQSGGPELLRKGAEFASVPKPWPAVCTGYDYCWSAAQIAGQAEWEWDVPQYVPHYALQVKSWSNSSDFSDRADFERLPGGDSSATAPAGVPEAPAGDGSTTDPGDDTGDDDPSGGTSRCFPAGFTWDVGGMLGGVVKCLFVPSDDFMQDLSSGFDSIGPTKLPVVLMGTLTSWDFSPPDPDYQRNGYCSGFSVNLSSVFVFAGHPQLPDFQMMNACPGEPLYWLARTASVVIGVGAVIAAVISIKRSVGAIVQYNTGGED